MLRIVIYRCCSVIVVCMYNEKQTIFTECFRLFVENEKKKKIK